jgi:Domain of unknown function (DUF4386)
VEKGEKMDNYRKTAVIVGILFITATVASILTLPFLGSTLDTPISLNNVNANENQVTIAVILELIAALSAFGTAAVIFPVLKKQTEGLAIAYVGLRLLENAFYVLGAVSLLLLLTISKESLTVAISASYQPLSSFVLALHDWSLAIGTVILAGIGSITLNYVLYQSKLVPRWLSAFGFIGAVLLVLYGLTSVISLNPNMNSLMILALPIALQEMVFAVWLIIKGFNPSAIASESPHVG